MEGKAVEVIADLAREAMMVDVDGETYSNQRLHRVYDDPRPSPLTVHTLTAIVDYLASNNDDLNLALLTVVISAFDEIDVVTHVHGDKNDRHLVMKAVENTVDRFPFGNWMDTDTFNIRARSLFVETDRLLSLLQFVSRIQIKDDSSLNDDGVSQSVSVRTGLSGHLTEAAEPPSLVNLRPFRTFTEIVQPESRFLFRMKRVGESVNVALFEADGGAWQNEAVQAIKSWLMEKLMSVSTDITILA